VKPVNHALRPYSAAELDSMMKQAIEQSSEGVLHMVNCNGDVGLEALDLIQKHVDGGQISSWQGIGGAGADGNCFFATTDLLVQLTDKNAAGGFKLVTGIFKHHLAGDIYHCWLEFRRPAGVVAINCSNLDRRPLYAMEREQYLEINQCAKRIQVVSAEDFQKRLKSMRARTKCENPDDLPRLLTKDVLKKTLFLLSKVNATS
jgi:hypothetical protein